MTVMQQDWRAVVTPLIAVAVLVSAGSASALDPQSFADVAGGVVQVKATGCPEGTVLGSGFLVGASVVMTANHVVDKCRNVRILVKDTQWVNAASWRQWRDGKRPLDVATLKLARPVTNAWIFSLRPSQVPLAAYIAAMGYPLGEAVSLTNGRVVRRLPGQFLLLKILGAQGYSGGPVVDSYGRVVGIINAGVGDPGLLTGATTGDNLIAYDVSSRWGGWRKALCQGYPNGGVEDC